MKSNLNSKRVFTGLASVILAGSFSLAAYAVDPIHAVDCTSPHGTGEARACEKAKQGPDALRRFVHNTRMIYGLYYWDFVPQDNDSQVAALPAEEKVAKSK